MGKNRMTQIPGKVFVVSHVIAYDGHDIERITSDLELAKASVHSVKRWYEWKDAQGNTICWNSFPQPTHKRGEKRESPMEWFNIEEHVVLGPK